MKKKLIIIISTVMLGLIFIFNLIFFLVPRISYKVIDDEAIANKVYGYDDCYEIDEYYKDYKVTKIAPKLFSNHHASSIILPETIEEIGRQAFMGCEGLTSFHIPSSTMYVDNNAFKDCVNLKIVTFGLNSKLMYIGGSMFFNCVKLETIVIPSSVKEICTYAFFGCESLTEIVIPSSVTDIANDVFYNCKSLKTVIVKGNPTLHKDWLCGAPKELNVVIEGVSNE